jgi:type IV pilus assembly protein PilO
MKLPFISSRSDDTGEHAAPAAQNAFFDSVGKLSPLQRAGAMVLMFGFTLFMGYWFDLSSSLDSLDAGRQQEAQLKTSFLEKKAQAVNLDAYKKQLRDVQTTFGSLLRELPNKSEMDDLLNGINQAGLGHGLQFDLFRPDPSEKMSEFYAEQPVSIKVEGSFSDLGAFAEDVSRLPRIVILDGLNIAVTQPAGKEQAAKLTMDATAHTYRYLDDHELAQARGAKKPAPGGK